MGEKQITANKTSGYWLVASSSRGVTTLLVVGFMGVFMIIVGTVTGYAFQQAKYGRALFAREQALHIAEAGLENFRWLLAHNTSAGGTVMTTGVGLGSLPTSYTVTDPEGGTVGTATITPTPTYQCGRVQWMDLASTGRADVSVGFPRTLLARYMKRSIAEYAYIYNSAVWFGSTNAGVGPYHANNGMRMDGTTNSIVTSEVSQVWCDGTSGSLGCNGVSPNPTAGWKTGVFGNSTATSLWQYPAAHIDFPGMALNFATLKGYAQTSGIMLNPTSVTRAGVQQGSSFSSVGGADNKGFHLIFKADGTVDVYRVTATNGNTIYSYNSVNGWRYDYPVIATEYLVTTVSLPSTCSIIYSEAKTWIEGTVSGKVTLFAADTGAYVPDIVFNNNIAYATADGTTGLTAVAEGRLQIGLIVPDTLSLRGIFVAQTDAYSRDYYYPASGYLPSAYYQYNTRSQLNVTGTIVSYLRGGVCYTSGGGTCSSGFLARNNSYDRVLAFSPPPFTPAISSDYSLVLWREQ